MLARCRVVAGWQSQPSPFTIPGGGTIPRAGGLMLPCIKGAVEEQCCCCDAGMCSCYAPLTPPPHFYSPSAPALLLPLCAGAQGGADQPAASGGGLPREPHALGCQGP